MAATKKSNIDTTGPLSVGAQDAVLILGRIARLALGDENELALALETLCLALLRAGTNLDPLVVAFARIDRRLAIEAERNHRGERDGEEKN